MSLRAGDATAGVRIDAINEENMKKYFDLLEEVYNELDFKDHPERIYNMDETGMPLDPHPPKVVVNSQRMKEGALQVFRSEISDHCHWLWQCNRPDNSTLHYLCCQATE